jgi:hypothetical protein
MALTIGGLLTEARALLQDVSSVDGTSRYSDADLIAAFNDAMLQTRAKRPDAFLTASLGLQTAVTQYTTSDLAVAFPLDPIFYPAFLFYVVGRSELREDTFADDSRAVTLANKFVSQLLQAAS